MWATARLAGSDTPASLRRTASRGGRLVYGSGVWRLFVLGGIGVILGATTGVAGASTPGSPPSVLGGYVQVVPGTGSLNGVACSSPSSCVAVGSVAGQGVVVPIDDGIPGSPQTVSGADDLSSVWCSTAGSCIAVGTGPYRIPPEPTMDVGVVAGIKNGVAGGAAPEMIGNGLPGAPDGVSPSGVSCTDRAHCMAVGSATYEDGFVVNILRGEAAQTLQSLSPLALSGVECVGNDWCAVVGQNLSADDRHSVGVTDFVQIGGSKGRVDFGASFGFGNGSNLNGVACHDQSLDFCVMAGADRHSGALFSIVGESSGHLQTVAGSSSLNDVACAGTYWCVAVGQTPTAQAAIVPVGWDLPRRLHSVPGADQFNGVTCPTPHFCVAVGYTGPQNPSTGVIDTFPVSG
jgi:hypothetical protein